MKKTVALLLAVLLILTLSACGSKPSDDPTDSRNSAPAAAGYEKTPVFTEVLPMAFTSVRLYQMQPVTTTDDADVSKKNLFLQCYVNANADNKLGYPSGAFVSGLLLEFEILDAEGGVAAAGRFQPLNAVDGPCYGANLSLKSGTYSVRLVMHSPQQSGYALITDAKTGPEKTFSDWFAGGSVEITRGGWTYTAA